MEFPFTSLLLQRGVQSEDGNEAGWYGAQVRTPCGLPYGCCSHCISLLTSHICGSNNHGGERRKSGQSFNRNKSRCCSGTFNQVLGKKNNSLGKIHYLHQLTHSSCQVLVLAFNVLLKKSEVGCRPQPAASR